MSISRRCNISVVRLFAPYRGFTEMFAAAAVALAAFAWHHAAVAVPPDPEGLRSGISPVTGDRCVGRQETIRLADRVQRLCNPICLPTDLPAAG